MTDFKVGDVVMLRSGGARMTVESVGVGGVSCVWFDKDKTGSAFRDAFKAEVLKPAGTTAQAAGVMASRRAGRRLA